MAADSNFSLRYGMALCDTCTSVWYGQTCNPKVNAHDFTDCWPPRSGSQASVDPGVMMGWGFYSPGIACPAGYTTVAMATAGGSSGWPVEYSLTDGETAAACCPTYVLSRLVGVRRGYTERNPPKD